MASTFHSIETSKRALFTQQAALSTVGHNIANANTVGYSRQRVNMVNAIPVEAYGMNRSNAPGQLGTGVEYESIARIRNSFLDQQYRDQHDNVGSLEVQNSTLSKLESYVAEPSDYGMRTVIDKFWTTWSDLSKDTENVTGRDILVEVSKTLADSFNDFNRQLTALDKDLTASLNIKVNEINTTWSSISSLNEQIAKIESLGDHANDLRDQRDVLTDKLSKLTNIVVMETPDQGYIINVAGTTLQAGATMTEEALMTAYTNGTLTGGETHGYIVARDVHVADFANEIKKIAETLVNGEIKITVPAGTRLPDDPTNPTTAPTTVTVNGINGLHKLGYTLEDPAQNGGNFFEIITDPVGATPEDTSNQTALGFRLEVNQDIVNNPSKIATSLKATVGTNGELIAVKGNNELALIMSELATTKFNMGAGTPPSTINDFYSASIGALGVQAQNADRLLKNSTTQLQQLESSRLAVSSVSLDEEMSDLIKFQYGYSSSARFMTTIDEILNKLINGTGRVGL